MQFKNLVAALAIAGLATAQAPTKGVAHIDNGNIDATFTFEKAANGVNVVVNVAKGVNKTIQVLPTGFEYHIHVKPVGANNDCMATGGHLNPTNVNYTIAKCNPSDLTSCEVGDLAGKHGNLQGTEDGKIGPITYTDTQISFEGDNSIVGRSVVIHNNVTRIACANIVTEGNNSTGGDKKPDDKPNSSAVKLAGSVLLSSVVALMMFTL
ncbi:hypothetical protein BGW41_000510 [Actinomortierella wolfii]|nr:hypothetical protein BGW41_000510 [Actinomortierella wolfii]